MIRVAIYYAPAADDPLWQAGADWLGRDPDTGAPRPQPPIDGIAEITAEARLYGFHATLKPPMRLAGTWDAFEADVAALATQIAPFDLPPLAVADLGGFLALRETVPSPALQALADSAVATLDAHRVPPDELELARRRRHGLPPVQDALLVRWGYPHVFGEWYFHMTLTRRLDAAEHARIRPAAAAHFAPALAVARRVADLCIFTQAGPGAPFLLAQRVPLGG